MKLSVVIPVHNGGDDLRRCLEALAASERRPDEVIVVDDGSTDGSGSLACRLGAQVIRLEGGPRGPAMARNRGAEAATGDALVFLDADVAVHPDTIGRLEACLAQEPQVAAAFGSYDADPPAPGLASRYKNLLHHYVHQHSQREASTFWAGCGAVRRHVFQALGGFDASYPVPSIEDIELGGRLRRAGRRIRLCPDAQVTHLKRWTLRSLLYTDICRRAVPWSRLIAREGRTPADLNVGVESRLSALAAWAAVGLFALSLWRPWALAPALLAVAALAALNLDLYRTFARQGGVGFAAGAAALHAVYLLYSSLVFLAVVGPSLLARRGLAILLVATLLNGLTWSIVVPPLYGPDESVHFLYGQTIERTGRLRFQRRTKGLWWPRELRLLERLAQVGTVRGSGQTLDLSDRASLAGAIAATDDPAARRDYRKLGGVPQIFTFHPPLYYLGVAAVQAPLEGASVRVRLLASRWFSVALAMLTVALAYCLGRELWPQRRGRALALATMAGFQPMVTFCTSVVANEALDITLFSACTLVALRAARRGLNWRRAAALGVLAGLGLLTKISFFSILPPLGLLFAWQVIGALRERKIWRTLVPWALVAALALLLSGWWYGEALWSAGRSMTGTFGTPALKPRTQLLPYLWHYPWLKRHYAVLRGYWSNFGQLDVPLPGPLTTVAVWLTWLGVLGAAGGLAWRATVGTWRRRLERALPYLLLGSAVLGMVAFYTYVDYRLKRDLGGWFGLQARYFLPPIAAEMALLGLGLTQLLPGRLRSTGWWALAASMAGLNLYSLYAVIGPRYYGPGGMLSVLSRATVLQPVSPGALAGLAAGFLAAAAGLLVAVGGALHAEPTA